MKNADLNLASIKPIISGFLRLLRRYASVLIFLLFMGVYGYMLLQINSLSNPHVGADEVAAEVKALPTPRIDQEAAAKLQALKDNSVNVQTLFEQGRTNPFQE